MRILFPVVSSSKYNFWDGLCSGANLLLVSGKVVSWYRMFFTLSPIIMVQWKMGPLNERKRMLEVHPFFTKNHDYGRKGSG